MLDWKTTRSDGKVRNWQTIYEGVPYECGLYLSPLDPWGAKPERAIVLIVKAEGGRKYLQACLSESDFSLDSLTEEALAWAEQKISEDSSEWLDPNFGGG